MRTIDTFQVKYLFIRTPVLLILFNSTAYLSLSKSQTLDRRGNQNTIK